MNDALTLTDDMLDDVAAAGMPGTFDHKNGISMNPESGVQPVLEEDDLTCVVIIG